MFDKFDTHHHGYINKEDLAEILGDGAVWAPDGSPCVRLEYLLSTPLRPLLTPFRAPCVALHTCTRARAHTQRRGHYPVMCACACAKGYTLKGAD